MTPEHFLTNIHITGFKCFNDFEVNTFSRVNLIGGMNNIGKTAFMEACYINIFAENINNFSLALFNVKFMRENINTLLDETSGNINYSSFIELSSGIEILSNINSCSYSISSKNGIKEYVFKLKDKLNFININEFPKVFKLVSNNINFIDNFGLSNQALIEIFAALQEKEEEERLNKILTTFFPDIASFKIINNAPRCKKENGNFLAITEFGDGVKHLIAIILSLYASEKGYLFIDEIDNGVHYTLLDELWMVIMTLAEELNVQVFATTHSKECIEAFNRQQDDEQSLYLEMAKNINTKKLFIRDLDKDQLNYELSNNEAYRGE